MMVRRRTRSPELPLSNPATDQREYVCLRVAAEFLKLGERAVLARLDDNRLSGWRDGKVVRISVASLAAYVKQRRLAS